MTEQSPLYSHQIYLTYTPDGKTFPQPSEAELILDHASVADLVIGPDGALWAYFVNGETGRHGIFAARQTADGSWETLGCVTLDGEFNGNAVDPNVTRLEDGRYRLTYFVGNFVTQTLQPGDENPIFSAISEDGLHFTVEGQIFAYPGATDPSLVQLPDGSWLLAVTAGGQTVLARSDDGYTFTEFGQPPREIGIPELFAFPDGTVALYLSRMFLSTDGGQTWQVVDGVQVPGNGADPSLVALPEGGYAFSFKQILADEQMGASDGAPSFNPFENMTDEQAACLREAWGDDVFNEITSFQRPPTAGEAGALDACGLQPPPDGGMPPGGGPSGQEPPGGPSGQEPPPGQVAQGNPEDVTLNLNLDAPYLMAFLACDTAASACDTPMDHWIYLAQSQDGIQWEPVPGWQPFQGSVPEIARRGETLYIFTPGAVTRYHLDTGVLEATQTVQVDGLDFGFVDPSILLTEDGLFALFFLPGNAGDPAGCGNEPECQRVIRSAVEVSGSDGTQFQLQPGDRITMTVGDSREYRSLSDPDVFFDGRQYVLLTSHGLSTLAWVSPELHGSYEQVGLLTSGTGGVADGLFDLTSYLYLLYTHYQSDLSVPAVIRFTIYPDLSQPPRADTFTTVISGESFGLGADWMVASPSVIPNRP